MRARTEDAEQSANRGGRGDRRPRRLRRGRTEEAEESAERGVRGECGTRSPRRVQTEEAEEIADRGERGYYITGTCNNQLKEIATARMC